MTSKKAILVLVLVVGGLIVVSGCIQEQQQETTTSTSYYTPTSTTLQSFRPIDIICPSDIDSFKNRVSEEWLYTPLSDKNKFRCAGNSVYCANCGYFHPSFVLTHQYNLTELNLKARQKGYSTEYWEGGTPYSLVLTKTLSENESYEIRIELSTDNNHEVVAYQNGECCLDKEYVRSQFRYILDDLVLEYSGLNESRIERQYLYGPATA